jgi:hypothetical protein
MIMGRDLERIGRVDWFLCDVVVKDDDDEGRRENDEDDLEGCANGVDILC